MKSLWPKVLRLARSGVLKQAPALLLALSAQVACAAPSYLSALEGQVLDELNRVRVDPKGYAKKLTELRRYYNGRLLELPGQVPLLTMEGPRALDEATRALRACRPAPAFTASRGMSRAARGHAEDIGPRGLTSHTGSNGSDPFRRLQCCGNWQGAAGENIQYGGRNAGEVVMQLLIDDGVPGRGHRRNILDPKFRTVGIGCGKHARFRTVCVIDFASGYEEK
jgi:hypothetical protein